MNLRADGLAGELRELPRLSESERLQLLERAVHEAWDSLGAPLNDAAEEAFAASVDLRFVLAELAERKLRDWNRRRADALVRDAVLGAELMPEPVFRRRAGALAAELQRHATLERVLSQMPARLSQEQQRAWVRRVMEALP